MNVCVNVNSYSAQDDRYGGIYCTEDLNVKNCIINAV